VSKLRKNTALIPFEAASGFLMVLIVAAMAFISCFALTASLMASKLADGWSDGLIGSATVPWFGGIPELEGLPAPSIVAVKVDPEREPDPTLIQARLDGAGLFAVYDDHGAWRARAKDASETVRMIGWVSVVLAALAIAATVFVVVRIAMASHRETIAALRLTGAEDRFVAGLYQRRYLWLGFLGGLLGCALAVLVGGPPGAQDSRILAVRIAWNHCLRRSALCDFSTHCRPDHFALGNLMIWVRSIIFDIWLWVWIKASVFHRQSDPLHSFQAR